MTAPEQAYEDWFKAEYPNTYRDSGAGMLDARVIYANSETAWRVAMARGREQATDALTDPVWRLILRDEGCIESPCDQADCECRQKLDRILKHARTISGS